MVMLKVSTVAEIFVAEGGRGRNVRSVEKYHSGLSGAVEFIKARYLVDPGYKRRHR
jgi:hypothetical protein